MALTLPQKLVEYGKEGVPKGGPTSDFLCTGSSKEYDERVPYLLMDLIDNLERKNQSAAYDSDEGSGNDILYPDRNREGS